MNAGAIVYNILMQGAAVFKKDAADAEQAVERVGAKAEASSGKVSKAGDAVDGLGKKAKGAKAPLDDIAKSEDGVGKSADSSQPKVKKLREEITTLSDQGRQSATRLGLAAVGIGAAIALVGGLAISTYSEFDAAMSRTAAATLASEQQQRSLADAAVDAGAATIYSAKESADAETELAKAGLSVKDILTGGLTGSLALAAAGQLDVARAAEIAAITLKQFNLDGTETGRVADVLAAGAGKSVGSVDDLANGLKFVGPIASQMGISLETTVGILSEFADQGIIGEQAGTAFRGMLLSLTSPSKAAQDELKRLSINLYDGQDKFIGMEGAAAQLQTGLGSLTAKQRDASLGIIFGNEQVTAARILYKGGASAVDEYTKAVSEQGYAAKQAWEMTNNLQGDVERLGGAFDSALIRTGAPANYALRDMVQLITVLVDWYGQLPAPVQESALVLGAAGAAVALLAGALLIAIPRIAEFRTSLQTLSQEMPRATAGVKSMLGFLGGPWGIAIMAATAVLGLFIDKQIDGAAKAGLYKSTLDEVTGAITAQTRAATAANLAAKGDWWSIYGSDSAADAAKKLKISLNDVTDAVYGNADQLKKIQDQYDLVFSGGPDNAGDRAKMARDLGLSATEYKNAVAILYDEVSSEKAAIAGGQQTKKDEIALNGDVAESTDKSAESAETAAGAYLTAADGAGELLDQLTQLLDKINESNAKGQDAITSNIAYKDSMSQLDEVIRKAGEGVDENEDGVADYTATLDLNTQAGRDNMDMLVDFAKRGRDAAQTQFDLDGNTQAFRQSLEDGHQAVIDRALALGDTADEAQILADNIAGIPSETEWKIITDTATASTALEAFIQKYNGVTITANLFLESSGGDRGLAASAARYTAQAYDRATHPELYQANGGSVHYYANGGYEKHVAQFARAGSTRIWAEPETGGEYYIPASPAKRGRSEMVLAAAAEHFGGQYISAGAQAFANGGYSGGDYSTSSSNTIDLDVNVNVDGSTDPSELGYDIGKAAARTLRKQSI
jgi:TP901 family phage tail tape measure protein